MTRLKCKSRHTICWAKLLPLIRTFRNVRISHTIDKQNNRHTISPQNNIVSIMPRSKKGLGRCHKSGTRSNQGRRRTTPRDYRGFSRNDFHSKSNELSWPVIYVSLPLNNSFINPHQLSSVCQQSSMSSTKSPCDNKFLNSNHIN